MSGLGHGLAPQTLAVLRFVQARPGVSTLDAFRDFEGAGDRAPRFRHRLQNLHAAGWLRHDKDRRSMGGWHITRAAADVLDAAPLCGGDDGADTSARARTPGVVPPRQIDVMSSDVYKPWPAVAYRDGALDYQACPSLMGSRSVPFWAAANSQIDGGTWT